MVGVALGLGWLPSGMVGVALGLGCDPPGFIFRPPVIESSFWVRVTFFLEAAGIVLSRMPPVRMIAETFLVFVA